MSETGVALFIAIILDYFFKDPQTKCHPVAMLGRYISVVQKYFFQKNMTSVFAGFLFLVIILISVLASILVLILSVRTFVSPLEFLIYILLIYFAIGFHSMKHYVRIIKTELETGSISSARSALQAIVGRDTQKLTRIQVIRSTVESISESFVDGFFAPLFWLLMGSIFGYFVLEESLPGAIGGIWMYRTVNTLDSMVGYKNEKFISFGKASAKFDDVLNFLPARVSILPMGFATLQPGTSFIHGVIMFVKHRLSHASPNSAHGMSFFSGALGLRLGGDYYYGGSLLQKPVIGLDRKKVSLKTLNRALRLYLMSGYVSVIVLEISFTILRF